MRDLAALSPAELRAVIRRGEWTDHTIGLAMGFVACNLVVLPRELAFDFLVFCQRNPKPCPVLEVTEVGSPYPELAAAGADLRTDLPRYRVWHDGELADEVTDIVKYWRDDLVAFLIPGSLTWEQALLSAGVPIRHLEERRNAACYRTNIPCRPAGPFRGPLVVNLRPLPPEHVVRAIQVTSRFPRAHGAPVHIGDPAAIGITNVNEVDFGEPTTIKPGEVPVFWATGVTAQAVAIASRPSFMITHATGCAFVADIRDEQLAVL